LNSLISFQKIGSWYDKTLVMDDIEWPGRKSKPPSGKPTKFHIKIVTLEEQPFVIYKDPMYGGYCPRRSVLVRIANDKIE
jgi:ionotropic glutamate receptor NMDA 2B